MSISDDKKELLRKKISAWVRQSRYRANKNGCEVDVNLSDIVTMYDDCDYLCAYCADEAASPDHPFPIKGHAPCVLANIVPCCDECRKKKKNHDILWFFKNGFISKSHLSDLISTMKSRKGGTSLRNFLRTLIPD